MDNCCGCQSEFLDKENTENDLVEILTSISIVSRNLAKKLCLLELQRQLEKDGGD